MDFEVASQRVHLHGSQPGTLHTAQVVSSLLRFTPQGLFLQQRAIMDVSQPALPDDMLRLLAEHEDIIVEPSGLPPARSHDHHIPITPGASPANVRPYRYPYVQKAESNG